MRRLLCLASNPTLRFFIVLLDRLQENKTVLVVERDAMLTVGESDVLPHTIIYTESSSIWLNVRALVLLDLCV